MFCPAYGLWRLFFVWTKKCVSVSDRERMMQL